MRTLGRRREREAREYMLAPKRGTTAHLHLIGGRFAYLWIGDKEGRPVGYVGGRATLRRLARAILEEVGDG